jgi:hypothetical protein
MAQSIRVVVANRPRLMRELVLEMCMGLASTPRAPISFKLYLASQHGVANFLERRLKSAEVIDVFRDFVSQVVE